MFTSDLEVWLILIAFVVLCFLGFIEFVLEGFRRLPRFVRYLGGKGRDVRAWWKDLRSALKGDHDDSTGTRL